MEQQLTGGERALEASEEAGLDTGFAVTGPFRDLYERLGSDLCGSPISQVMDLDGVPTQFFERVVMEEYGPGQVRLKAVGQQLLDHHLRALRERAPRRAIGLDGVVDLIGQMPLHAERRYEMRPMQGIRYLVIHHTRASPGISPHELAQVHVQQFGWPGMGYHFVVASDGTIYQTNDLATVSFHARQFNRMAVGIALAGDFSSQAPPDAQLEAVSRLCVYLLAELGLSVGSVRGHRDLVYTTCPGDQWVEGQVWRESLLARVREMAGAER